MSPARSSRRYSIKTSTRFLSHHTAQFSVVCWTYLLDKNGWVPAHGLHRSQAHLTHHSGVWLTFNCSAVCHASVSLTAVLPFSHCSLRNVLSNTRWPYTNPKSCQLLGRTHISVLHDDWLPRWNSEALTDDLRVLPLGHLLLSWGVDSFPSNQYIEKPVCLSLN